MRRVCVAFAALALLAVAAPAAQADHLAPTVTATLELGGRATDDCDQVSGFPRPLCGGARRARISWNASCGPSAPPDALQEIEVGILGVAPNGRRFGYDGEVLDYQAPLVGSLAMTAGPGLRFLGRVVVKCSVETTDAEGNLVEHRGEATADTTQLYLPPYLAAFRNTRASFCGVNLRGNRSSFLLQADQYAEMSWYPRYSAASLIRRGTPEIRQIKLFARGAGIRVKASPDRGILNEFGDLGTSLRPRRAGKLRIWATIGGKRTNALRVTVLPKRC
jgi:hypothetical protein